MEYDLSSLHIEHLDRTWQSTEISKRIVDCDDLMVVCSYSPLIVRMVKVLLALYPFHDIHNLSGYVCRSRSVMFEESSERVFFYPIFMTLRKSIFF